MRFELSARAARLVVVVALLGAAACADFKRGEYWADDETGGAGSEADGEYGYAADVHALMDAGCERCHAPGNSAGDTDFLIVSDDLDASYASTLEFVDLDDPGASRLLTKMAGEGHGGGAIFDDRSAEYDLVLAWIEQGAPP